MASARSSVSVWAAACVAAACSKEPTRNGTTAATYVGSATCIECHAREAELWRGSHHDLAMQEATAETVLGDFSGATLEHFGVTSTFSQRDGHFIVRTDGPDGELADFEVAYVFGVTPLQQYLVAFPDGRLQSLQVAWDSRPAEAGGQRWFHLYSDEPTPAGDELHWTGRRFNWNSACAECHSTDLRRNYDAASETYTTAYEEIDVACETCHGPGSGHVAWATDLAEGRSPQDPAKGLAAELVDHSGGEWVMDEETGIAVRSAPPAPDVQLDACGRCHSRRWQMAEGYGADEPLLDTHLPSLLEADLYWPDGQILDEVYEWGSFAQSRMHAKGVRCSDCHDPHSLRLRAEGNALCTQCHLDRRYDTPQHHHHAADGPGAACVDCHMAPRTYMQVDARRDHSFRVPRPDLTQKLGVPNACNGCHTDAGQDAAWAAQQVAEWFPASASRAKQHFAEALAQAREGSPRAAESLTALVEDLEQAAVVRATALAGLVEWPAVERLPLLRAAVDDAEGVVRLAALRALESYPAQVRAELAGRLLADRYRAIRSEAARRIADVGDEALSPEARGARAQALAELTAAERLNADTPEAHLNLGLLALARGDGQSAASEYRTALRLDPAFVPAAVNLSDLLREQGKEDEAFSVLESAVRAAPRQAALHHALGLALVRAQRRQDALASLGRAVELAPDVPRYAYVLAVALQDAGSADLALQVLERGLKSRPHDPELLFALAVTLREGGRIQDALVPARKLAADRPGDPNAAALLRELEGAAADR
jgi:predicted CXXCH cytochrome family protein